MPQRFAQAALWAVVSIVAPGSDSSLEATGTIDGDDRPRASAPEVVARRDVERTMRHHDPVIQQALTILDQAVNPIVVAAPHVIREMYARRPGAGVPPLGLIAFRAPGDANDPVIYVNRESPVYKDAVRKTSALTLLMLAATLAHEQVHNTDGECAAYRLQSDFVRSRLRRLPSNQREQGHRYLQALDARARMLAHLAHSAAATARAATPP